MPIAAPFSVFSRSSLLPKSSYSILSASVSRNPDHPRLDCPKWIWVSRKVRSWACSGWRRGLTGGGSGCCRGSFVSDFSWSVGRRGSRWSAALLQWGLHKFPWMKVEGSASGVEKRSRKDMGAIRNAEKVIRKKGGGGGVGRGYHRKPRRRVEATSTAIKRLFLACKGVFKGPGTVPAPADVQMLQKLLDKMRPEDIDLSADLPFFRARTAGRGTPRISYTTIYQCKNFSMCIFFLPPTAVIPLHNHPGMTVFSKLLLGSMHIKSYDFANTAESLDNTTSSQRRLATLVVDSDFTAPCDTSVLYPTTGGNIHTFTAITPCAVLDVLGPPYSQEDGRDITYYRDYPYSSVSDGTGAGAGAGAEDGNRWLYGWLEESDAPDEARMMDPIEYLGPQII